jgi:hypothetical protein
MKYHSIRGRRRDNGCPAPREHVPFKLSVAARAAINKLEALARETRSAEHAGALLGTIAGHYHLCPRSREAPLPRRAAPAAMIIIEPACALLALPYPVQEAHQFAPPLPERGDGGGARSVSRLVGYAQSRGRSPARLKCSRAPCRTAKPPHEQCATPPRSMCAVIVASLAARPNARNTEQSGAWTPSKYSTRPSNARRAAST